MVEHEAQVIISGARRHDIKHYLQYMHRLWMRRSNVADDPMLQYARGWEDYLQTPLQPLADNLDTHTYNVFEKDPIKYDQYQKAIAKALTHFKTKSKVIILICEQSKTPTSNEELSKTTSTNEVQNKNPTDEVHNQTPVTVMVLGAGRGPLVIAVEKNPCAVVVLAAQVREVWRDRDVTVVPGDMRRLNLSPKADIIVSELLDWRGLPLTDNRRAATVTWEVKQDNVMHGFGGYFDCSLYGGEMISIVPSTHNSHKVWYEWLVEVGDRATCIHNTNGRSSEMLL
ncbi:Protein arginine N-methyltransferase [Operophtera brumata]|uniref:Protein arginine N-methyltransferase n=1 Tax=Operophtera brumata TaxID=104452 RepID=A0A0L7KQJ9_OPEBR|nr:Protein arginine N-methyltransferase [Operophtera brumata]